LKRRMDRIRINFAERSMRRRAESSGPNSRTQEAKRVSDCYWRLEGLYGHHRTTAHGDERWMSGSRDAGRPRETGDRRRRAGGGHRVGKGGGRREQQGSPAGTRTCVCTRTAVPERAVLDLWTVGRSAPGVTRAQLAVLRDASGTLIHVGTVATVIRVP